MSTLKNHSLTRVCRDFSKNRTKESKGGANWIIDYDKIKKNGLRCCAHVYRRLYQRHPINFHPRTISGKREDIECLGGRDPLCVLSYYKILTCILRSRVDILGDAKLYTKVDGDSFNNTADDFQLFPECFSFRESSFLSQPFYGSPSPLSDSYVRCLRPIYFSDEPRLTLKWKCFRMFFAIATDVWHISSTSIFQTVVSVKCKRQLDVSKGSVSLTSEIIERKKKKGMYRGNNETAIR